MKNKVKISFILNIITIIFTIIGSICRFTGFRFMNAPKIAIVDFVNPFLFFTVDSNILIGVISFVFAIYEYLLLKNKINRIPNYIYILKYIFTVNVALTLLITAIYLAPFSKEGFYPFFANSNLFFHLIVPVLGIVNFVLFEKTKSINYKKTFFGLIPMVMYSVFYIINGLVHMKESKVEDIYDWYGFFRIGNKYIIIVFLIMLFITYMVCLILWYFNKKINNKISE